MKYLSYTKLQLESQCFHFSSLKTVSTIYYYNINKTHNSLKGTINGKSFELSKSISVLIYILYGNTNTDSVHTSATVGIMVHYYRCS